MGGIWPAHVSFKRFSAVDFKPFMDSWRAQREVHLDETQQSDEVPLDDRTLEANAEWLGRHFPAPDFEIEWDSWQVIDLIGEWFLGSPSDISLDTDLYNTCVASVSPAAIPSILAETATAYCKLLASGAEDDSGFLREAPALLRYLAECLEAGDWILILHENPC